MDILFGKKTEKKQRLELLVFINGKSKKTLLSHKDPLFVIFKDEARIGCRICVSSLFKVREKRAEV